MSIYLRLFSFRRLEVLLVESFNTTSRSNFVAKVSRFWVGISSRTTWAESWATKNLRDRLGLPCAQLREHEWIESFNSSLQLFFCTKKGIWVGTLNNSSQSWTCNRPQTGWVCCVPFARTRVDNSFNSFPKRYRSTLIREIIATNSVKNLLCATRCSLRWQLTARESRYNYLGTKIFAKKVWSSQENELNIMYTILIDNNAVESGLVLQKL